MNSKVKCLMRYIEKLGHAELSEFLISNKLVNPTDISGALHTQERAELIYVSLVKAEAEEKLLLLDFEWSILPLEQIKITCVTSREERYFTYGF